MQQRKHTYYISNNTFLLVLAHCDYGEYIKVHLSYEDPASDLFSLLVFVREAMLEIEQNFVVYSFLQFIL